MQSKQGAWADKNTVSYVTSWEFKDDGPDFTRYEILYCKTACEIQVADKGNKESVKELDYDTEYTVVVSAVLGKDEEERKFSSFPSVINTVSGKPGLVQEFEVVQNPDTLDLSISWQAPSQPNGKIESYQVQIIAEGNELFV